MCAVLYLGTLTISIKHCFLFSHHLVSNILLIVYKSIPNCVSIMVSNCLSRLWFFCISKEVSGLNKDWKAFFICQNLFQGKTTLTGTPQRNIQIEIDKCYDQEQSIEQKYCQGNGDVTIISLLLY